MSVLKQRQKAHELVAPGLTNKYGLPDAIVAAIIQQREDYDNQGSNLSASGVTDSPRQYWLKKRHKEEIVEDVSDLVWSLLGNSVHNILEQAGKQQDKDKYLIEQRFSTEILGWKFSGQLDHFDVDNATLSDYKITSVYAVKDGHKKEWEAQLNCLRLLLHLHSIDVDKLSITAILRDWRKAEAERNKDYVQSQVKVVDIPVWEIDDTYQVLKDKIEHLQKFEEVPDDMLPPCSSEERWAKPTKWAVMKEGQKRAVKLFDDGAGAKEFIRYGTNSFEGNYYIEERTGESIRCKGYCSVNKWCNQWQEMQNGV